LSFLKTYRIPLLFSLLCAIMYASFAYDLIRSDFAKLISLYAALFFISYKLIQTNKNHFWLLAGLGLVFRFVFMGAIPNLSQDFYRFLWDGRLMVAGINPYLITPETYLESGNLIVPQAQELYQGMGALNGSHYSNYPPINQLCFAIAGLVSGKSILGSVIVLRLLIILADIGILYFGKKLLEKLRLPTYRIFWYFLNPFIIIELTGNLHFESVMLFFLVASLYLIHEKKWFWSAVLLGASVSVKLIPLLFLPLFFQWFVKKESLWSGFISLTKFYFVVLLTVVLSFAPFLSSEFVINFSKTISLWFQNFEFNASIYYIIRWIGFKTIGWNIIEDVGKILPLIVVAFLMIMSFFRKNKSTTQLIPAMLLCISFYFLLSTTVHPWYVATPLALSIFTRYRFPIIWSFTVILSYAAYNSDVFSENLWLVGIEYVVVIGFFIWELQKKPNPMVKKTI